MWAPSGYAGCLPLDACPGYPHLLPPLRFFPWSSGGLKLHSSDLSLQPPAMTTASCPPRQNPERCPCLQLAALAQQPGVAFSSSAEDTAQTSLHTASPWHFSWSNSSLNLSFLFLLPECALSCLFLSWLLVSPGRDVCGNTELPQPWGGCRPRCLPWLPQCVQHEQEHHSCVCGIKRPGSISLAPP